MGEWDWAFKIAGAVAVGVILGIIVLEFVLGATLF
jgi:hypothetical protein